MPGTVRVNGTSVATAPETLKWPLVIDQAYINVRPAEHSGGIAVYNLGVLVCELPAYIWGLSGTVVSRQQPDVNFARTTILDSCPVWKAIKKHLQSTATTNTRSRTTLSNEERVSLIHRITTGVE